MRKVRFIVEKHIDGYVAYPIGIWGVVVGEGDTYKEALEDAKSAVRAHVETFGQEVIDAEEQASAVYLTEAEVTI